MSSTASAQILGVINPEQEQEPENREASFQRDIAQLAYALWERRGCPEGSSDEDWREAEQQLRIPETTSAGR